jgi:hypothetical protein
MQSVLNNLIFLHTEGKCPKIKINTVYVPNQPRTVSVHVTYTLHRWLDYKRGISNCATTIYGSLDFRYTIVICSVFARFERSSIGMETASMYMCGIHPGCERYAIAHYTVGVRMSTELSVLDTIEVWVNSA